MWLSANPQLDKKGQLHHLLTLEGLPAEILWQILDTAKSFVGMDGCTASTSGTRTTSVISAMSFLMS